MKRNRMGDKLKLFFQKYPLMVAICYFCFYFPIFTLLEAFRQPEYFIHCSLDDWMPFCEYFVIPYVMWFAFVPGMLLFFLRFSKTDYFKCCKVIFGGMTVCLLIYALFPTGLMLRQPVENDNIFAMFVNFIRAVDTPTNVCPSIHVSSTVGICLVLCGSKELKRFKWLKIAAAILGVLICLSTMLLDQHSAIDVICGAMLSTVLYYMVSTEPKTEPGYQWHNEILH